MASFVDLCKKHFDNTDLYKILGIQSNAKDQEVRKAYHKLSLKVHPDRVDEGLKEECTEKFQILGRIYSILSNKEKRSVYDQTGSLDEDAFEDSDFDWLNYWKCIFRPLTEKDYRDYEIKYKGSDEEAMDLKKAYINGKGDMDFILDSVPFTTCSEEPRLRSIIQKFIDENEVPVFDSFINESPRKAARRKRKYEREATLAAKIASPVETDETGEEALRQMIESRQRDRGEQMNNFFDKLAAKYGGKNSASKTSKKRKRT